MPAPRGNTNHLKHGLYSRRFSPEQQAGLRRLSPDDLLQEIAALRVTIDAILAALAQPGLAPAEITGLAASLSRAATALSTLSRTRLVFMKGGGGEVESALREALLDFDPDEP